VFVEEPVAEVVAPEVAELLTAAAAPQPVAINLHNGPAVSSALLSCGLAFLLSIILGPLGLGLLALVCGGFFAVYLYRRKTGQPVSVLNGMRLGWIAGIFVFTLITIVTTMLAFALSQPDLAAQLREQLIKNSYSAEEVTALFEGLQSASGIGLILVGMFVSSTLPPALGGAMGAKLLGRN